MLSTFVLILYILLNRGALHNSMLTAVFSLYNPHPPVLHRDEWVTSEYYVCQLCRRFQFHHFDWAWELNTWTADEYMSREIQGLQFVYWALFSVTSALFSPCIRHCYDSSNDVFPFLIIICYFVFSDSYLELHGFTCERVTSASRTEILLCQILLMGGHVNC